MDPFDLRQWEGFIQAGGCSSQPAITDQITIDSRRIAANNALFVALEGKVNDGHHFIIQAVKAGARYILAKKGWCSQEPLDDAILLLVDNPLSAFQEIAATYRSQLPCRIIAIVGSYGKTMVKDLLQNMLKQTYSVAASPESFNSQIGVPLSLLTIRKEHEIALIEAGFSEKNEIDILAKMIAPDFSILTHVGKKHLSTLDDQQTIASEMMKMISCRNLCTNFPLNEGWALIPKDPHLLVELKNFTSKFHYWTDPTTPLPHAQFVSDEQGIMQRYVVDFPQGTRYEGQVSTGFYYFLDLINIAVKAAWLLKTPQKNICESLEKYIPEPMRTEIWKSSIGALFINDTYCSDPQSVDTALKHFRQSGKQTRNVFIFGGMRGGRQHPENDYQRIGKAILNANVNLLILYGEHNHFVSLMHEIHQHQPQMEIIQCSSFKEALDALKTQITPDDTILLKGENKHPLDLITETFNDSVYNNQCFINLAAIAENIQTIRRKIGIQTRCMVMVKAFAYGTDEIRMAKFLETCGINILGVSYADEGIVLKRAGISQSIFVINAATYEAAKIVKWDMEVGVSDQSLIEAIASESMKQNKIINLHLHVNTGMGRFGCRPEDALGLAQLIISYPSLKLHGIMTHFACADDPNQDPFTYMQVECFDKVITELQTHGINIPWHHAANSSACMRFHFPHYNMVRLGLAVYGLHASKATKESLELRLALSIISRIVGINECKKGETISYGRNYCVERHMQKIAVLPIGYFDGLHRNYSGKGVVIVRGQKALMTGNICMDFMMIDVTDVPKVATGDPVLIFGEDEYGHYLSPEDLASSGDSIVHELITCLGPRIPRIFVHEEARRSH